VSNKEKGKVAIALILFALWCGIVVYAGWKYPEMYILPQGGHYIMPYVMEIGKINI
jgi:hypothetical protein